MRKFAVPVAIAAVVLLAGCQGSDAAQEAAPSPSFSGPAWNAYKAGRAFGQEHQDTATVAAKDAAQVQGDSLSDAMDADGDNARLWCRRNLPSDLEAVHAEYEDELLFGCVGGVFPLLDKPEIYLN